MSLILIGTDDRHAPLPVREKLSFSRQEILSALALLIEKGIVQGAVILSTCQRVEIYAQTAQGAYSENLFLRFKNLSSEKKDIFYIKQNEEAVLHLFTIAAGLDSRILGEGEILHQVKEAYGVAKNFEATTPFLNKLFERALFAGKLVRQETGLSKPDSSIAVAAVRLAESVAGELAAKNIFVIGAGVVAQGVVRHCAEKGAKSIVVANRTFLKAQELAKKFHAEAIRFEDRMRDKFSVRFVTPRFWSLQEANQIKENILSAAQPIGPTLTMADKEVETPLRFVTRLGLKPLVSLDGVRVQVLKKRDWNSMAREQNPNLEILMLAVDQL